MLDVAHVRETTGDLELHVDFALRSQREVQMIEMRLSAFPPATFPHEPERTTND
jgi:hypothetical protein